MSFSSALSIPIYPTQYNTGRHNHMNIDTQSFAAVLMMMLFLAIAYDFFFAITEHIVAVFRRHPTLFIAAVSANQHVLSRYAMETKYSNRNNKNNNNDNNRKYNHGIAQLLR